MLKNYLQLAWRHLLKSQLYSSINITGLAIGMAVAMLIALWIWDEYSFDQYHEHYHRLAQLYDTQTWNGKTNTDREIDIPLENELKTLYPDDFRRMALVSPGESGHLLSVCTQKITASGLYTQPEFPEMMTLQMLAGSRDGLKDPSSILLAASLARALFGNTDPLNRTIRIDSNIEVKVAGIYQDLPKNTTFNYVRFLLPWDKRVSTNSWVKESSTLWGRHAGRLIIELKENSEADKITAKIKDLPKKYIKEGKEEILLYPMEKWHLYNEFKDGKAAGGRIRFIELFGAIGVFVLLLACINFMNLSTARSEQRAKEVGIRKAIGSLRGQLIMQFLSESMLMSFLALLLAILLVLVLLPFFNTLLAGRQISFPARSPAFWLLVTGFAIFTGLIAGSYPAFYLSGFDPVKVLKGPFRSGRFAALPRQILVTIQFTVSITLIIGTILVYRQIQFAKDRPVGYNRDGLIIVNTLYSPGLVDHFSALRNELLRTGQVENMASSNGSPTEIWNTETGYDWIGRDPNSNPQFRIVAVTHDYGKTLGWNITAGRDFSRDFVSDTSAIILNEAAVRLTGFKDPVGQTIRWHGQASRIIGVVKDLVMESPYKEAEPSIFFLSYDWSSYLIIRIRPELPMQQALSAVAAVFKKYDADRPFDYRFVDEEYSAKFAAEQRIGNLAAFFTSLAIFISCLGLFGLASFVAERRTKEIGIRRVLGATILNCWSLLSKEFVTLVLLSFLIAVPAAAYYLKTWLQGYEYHTQLSWWIFAAAGLGTLLITLLTVSAQSIKAASMNPVKSLRTE